MAALDLSPLAVSRSASAAGRPMWGGRIAAMIAATCASVGSVLPRHRLVATPGAMYLPTVFRSTPGAAGDRPHGLPQGEGAQHLPDFDHPQLPIGPGHLPHRREPQSGSTPAARWRKALEKRLGEYF